MLLDALAARGRREAAITPDGETWLDVGTLLDRARAAAEGPAAVGHGRVRMIPTTDAVAAVVELLAAQLSGAVPVLAASGLDGANSTDGTDGTDAGRLLAAAAEAGRRHAEPLLVVVTSGTTGRPRAVVRTARSWQASLPAFDTLLGPECPPGSVVWVPGGPASTLTLFGLWHALATGRPAVASGRWRPDHAARAGATAVAIQCVPTVLADVLDLRRAGALPALRRAVLAGAAVPPGLPSRARATGVRPSEYYGAAELSFVASDHEDAGLRAFPGVEVSVRDGRITVRSPYLALGYLPAGTAGPLQHGGDGWATVGDRGSLDPDGRLTVLGRGNAVASVGGHVVQLDDVERAFAGVPGVAEVVCLAEPDARLGARVLAVVRPATRPDEPPVTVADLRAVARELLPGPARPVRYVLRTDLPRTPGGKPARAALLAELVPDGSAAGRTLAT